MFEISRQELRFAEEKVGADGEGGGQVVDRS